MADVIWMRINYGLDGSEDAKENLAEKHTLTKKQSELMHVFRYFASFSAAQRKWIMVCLAEEPITSSALVIFLSSSLSLSFVRSNALSPTFSRIVRRWEILIFLGLIWL